MAEAMTPHEKECAVAAIALLIERAPNKDKKELRKWLSEIEAAPLIIEGDGQ